MEGAATRICIYTKAVMGLVGCGERSARKIISRVRQQYHKEPHQPVSLPEFCAYMGFSENEVQKRLH